MKIYDENHSPILAFICLSDMGNLRKDIDQLIMGYLSGNLTDEECIVLEESLKDKTNKKVFCEKVQVYWTLQNMPFWKQLDDVAAWNKTRRKLNRQGRYIKWVLRYVALMILILGCILFFKYYSMNNDSCEVLEGVTLTFENGKTLILNEIDKQWSNADSTLNIELKGGDKLVYTELKDKNSDVEKRKIHYNTLTVPRGCNFLLQLSDGSKVWLNAESTLKYPEFFEVKNREVELTGEGYFEVAKDSVSPFSVVTNGSKITVLGTSFNLKSYNNDPEIVTTLVTGCIRQSYESGDSVVLTSNVQAVYTKKNCSVSTQQTNTTEALGWKNGRFVMKNRPLREIFVELARWYDVEVEYESSDLQNVCYYII